MQTLVDSVVTHPLNAPISSIDLAEWLFTLTDEEYQACSHAHLAGAISRAKNGKRMSINVEMLGEDLLVEHYVEDISERTRCKVVSITDVLAPFGRTTIEVIWEVAVKQTSDTACEFSNRVIANATQKLLDTLAAHKITDIAPVQAQMRKNAEAHNHEETPNFAGDIERKALTGIWRRQ